MKSRPIWGLVGTAIALVTCMFAAAMALTKTTSSSTNRGRSSVPSTTSSIHEGQTTVLLPDDEHPMVSRNLKIKVQRSNVKGHAGASSSTPKRKEDVSLPAKARKQEAPLLYGGYCEPKPRGEQELWNTRKKIISYSLDGQALDDTTTLLKRIKAHVQESKFYYPSWIMRIHVANSYSDADINQLLQLDTSRIEVIKCNTTALPPQMTRLLAIDDPTVHLYICRSFEFRPVHVREMLAVHQWQSSQSTVHVMRDHPLGQHAMPIVSHMMGMKASWSSSSSSSTTMALLIQEYLRENHLDIANNSSPDVHQQFLIKTIWPLVRKQALAHDDNPFQCSKFKSGKCMDYPLGPNDWGYYVGMPFDDDKIHRCNLNCKYK